MQQDTKDSSALFRSNHRPAPTSYYSWEAAIMSQTYSLVSLFNPVFPRSASLNSDHTDAPFQLQFGC